MENKKKEMFSRRPREVFRLYRRQFIYSGLLAGIAGVFQACAGNGFQLRDLASQTDPNSAGIPQDPGMSDPSPQPQPDPQPGPQPQPDPQPQPQPQPSPTPKPIPANSVKLSEFGGVPGAGGAVIANAFSQAFAHLKSLGGGTLFIAPGTYNLGSYYSGSVITVSNLSNVLVSGYGVQLQMTTTATETMKTPVFFNLQNPNNVTFAGLSFYDFGAKVDNRSGAVCFVVMAQRLCSGFKIVDCVADNVIAFLQSDQRDYPYMFEGFDIQATIKNSYYGLSPKRSGRFSKCKLNCLNVRRAFIGQSVKDWEVNVNTNRTGGLASNAHVVFDAFPSWPVQDCVVNIVATGALNGYNSIGSICHQGPDGSSSVARNMKFNIQINNASSAASTGFISFTAEPESGGGIRSSTASIWENVTIQGNVVGSYSGKIVANPSVSSASGNSIYVASNLAAYQNLGALPSYFIVK